MSQIVHRREGEIYHISGIGNGICFNADETPYINVAAVGDLINERIELERKHILNPRKISEAENSDESRIEQVSKKVEIRPSSNENLIRHFKNICPIISENKYGDQECEGKLRRINGTFNSGLLKNCSDPRVRSNKIFCNSTGQEFDIFCSVLPSKTTSITLTQAQDLCRKKFDSETVTVSDTESYDEAETETVAKPEIDVRGFQDGRDETTTTKDFVVVESTTEKEEIIVQNNFPIRELHFICLNMFVSTLNFLSLFTIRIILNLN